MPGFQAEVPHSLGKTEALDRLKSFVDRVQEKYRSQVDTMDGAWEENVLSFSLATFGMKVAGTLTVEESIARVEGKLPLAAMFAKGTIEKTITGELQSALG